MPRHPPAGSGVSLTAIHRWCVRTGYRIAYRRHPITLRQAELEVSQWWPRDRLLVFQWQRLQRLIRFAYERVPYYRRLMDSLELPPDAIRTPDDYRRLPILTKADIRAHRDDLLARGVSRDELVATGSGGSTGTPVALYHDRAMVTGAKAVKLRNFRWAGWEPGDAWARLWGNNFDIAPHQQLRRRLWDRLTRVRWLTCFDLTNETMAHYADDLAAFRPEIIEAYVNPLYLFARFLEAEGRVGTIRPRGIIVSAEMLFPHQRETMERVFGCTVFNRYGGREMGDVAHECERGTMHLNAETIYTEFIRDGSPAPSGETGEIILTALDLYAMPLLRYQVEDTGSPSDVVCPCGRGLPAMAAVQGRVQDLITLRSGRYLTGVFFAHLFKDFDVARFQVVQESLDRLIISLVRGPSLTDADLAYIEDKLREYTHGEIVIEVRQVDAIPLTASGKHRPTISHVPPDLAGAIHHRDHRDGTGKN